jgi:hypothetical protein
VSAIAPANQGISPQAGDARRSPEGRMASRLEYLNQIGIALSQERDINKLLETILVAAKNLSHADGGTLYRLVDGKLQFEIVRTDSLSIAMGGTTGTTVPFYPIPLHDKDGKPNYTMIAAYAALTQKTVNIPDAYVEEGFDFSGTRNFDKRTGYRSKSFLTVPMKNHESEIIGVLQLINATDPDTGTVIPFSDEDQHLAESLASQAAIALTNRLLIQQLEVLFESLIDLINTAIDEKSPYTGGHCKRVPALTMMIAEAAHNTQVGALADFHMSEKDRYELKIAGLLHDCGKITTPVHVVDKATKLETIFDRVALVTQRFEVLKRDAEIDLLRGKLTQAQYEEKIRQYDDDREFLRKANVGGERMKPEDQARVSQIAAYEWVNERARGIASSARTRKTTSTSVRHAHAERARDHQPPHRGDDQDARGAALAAAPHQRARIRRRAPRAHGRQGLSARLEARADERAGAPHGHRRHLRGAHRQGPAVQAGQDAFRVARDPREDA